MNPRFRLEHGPCLGSVGCLSFLQWRPRRTSFFAWCNVANTVGAMLSPGLCLERRGLEVQDGMRNELILSISSNPPMDKYDRVLLILGSYF